MSTCYQGFDTVDPPSTSDTKTWLTNSPFKWFGYYLGGCCFNGGTQPKGWTTTVTYDDYTSQGWGLRAIFVGQQVAPCPSPCPTLTASNAASEGVTAAQNAISLAHTAGFPAGATIFLDVEGDYKTLPSEYVTYVKAWADEVRNDTTYSYKPGLYASGCTIEALKNGIGDMTYVDYYWVPDYGSRSCGLDSSLCTSNFDNTSGCPVSFPSGAPLTVWQYASSTTDPNCPYGGCYASYGGVGLCIDYDTAVSTGSGGVQPG